MLFWQSSNTPTRNQLLSKILDVFQKKNIPTLFKTYHRDTETHSHTHMQTEPFSVAEKITIFIYKNKTKTKLPFQRDCK